MADTLTPQDWEQLGAAAASRFPGKPTPEVPQLPAEGVHPVTNPVMGAGAPPPGLDPTQQQQLGQQLAPAPAPTAPPATDEMGGMAPPGPQTVTTQDQHTQYQSGVKIDPALVENNQVAQADAQKAVAHMGEIQAKAQEKIAEAEAERARRVENERIVQENAAEKRRLEQVAAMEKINNAQAEAEKLQAPPEESLGTKIKNSIAIALSTFGSALTGSRNGALDVIEADRAHKMQAWKAAYERAKGKVNDQRNMYALLRERGLDDQQAEAAAMRSLNGQYDALVRQISAGSAAPITMEQTKITLAKLAQDNLHAEAQLQSAIQPRSVTVSDTKSVTKLGGADSKEKRELIKEADGNEEIKDWKSSRRALARFNDAVNSGAGGTAIVDFVASGLKQGSFGPSFVELLKKRGFIDSKLELVRSAWEGGVAPDLIKEIGTTLAKQTLTAQQRAKKAIRYYGTQFEQAGIPRGVLTGGATDDEAAQEAGFSRKAAP